MKNRFFAPMALAAGIALLATGCSAEADEVESTTDATEAAESTAPESTDAPAEGGLELPETLTLALVPSDEVEQITTDGEALAAALSDQLGIDVEVFVPESYSAVVVALQTGQADIGFLGPIAMVQAENEANAQIVLQSVRYGSSEYVGQWFTTDTDTFCLDEVQMDEDGFAFCNGATGGSGPAGEDALALVGADSVISFVDPSSASGYYFPATQLSGLLGIDPINDIPNALFAGGHPQSVQAVYDGDAVVGISFNDARSSLADEFSDVGEKVVVFAYTGNIPNDGVVVSGDLDADATQAITDALLALAETEEGAAALSAVYSIDGLEVANQDAFDTVVRPVEENFGE
ncbi:phosphate/phosphite/phosphonate ABC transporter substrate-binding protein [Demequina pelophila]|uniref:phosphate/phosphite/phosphonate ABC transporter substrate-binding protein n=1 Tax=Demequina pelophila TaxID=1638984 RepID=UPI000AD155E1|nr:phosphate/phosphite/phosphonate ABC transporter substrate-binding protein [Demequina pelophila]